MKNVKIKFLKNVGPHAAGDIVEFPEDQANEICKSTMINDGNGLIPHQKAILISELEKFAEKMEAGAIDLSKISQHELKEMGFKHLVKSESDPALEAKLVQMSKPLKDEFEEIDEELKEEKLSKKKGK